MGSLRAQMYCSTTDSFLKEVIMRKLLYFGTILLVTAPFAAVAEEAAVPAPITVSENALRPLDPTVPSHPPLLAIHSSPVDNAVENHAVGEAPIGSYGESWKSDLMMLNF
jgi:hypothetical protein